jgi:L-lysine 2,3-aminomutase
VRFRKNLNPSNKEWIKSVDFKTITDYIVSLCELMNIEYKIVVNDPIVQNMEICGEDEEEEEDEDEEEKEEERKKLNGKYECMTCHECNISEKRAMNCVYCARQLSRKVKQRPTREQLLDDARTMSMVDIGKKYGVSDNCIRKWIKN